MGDLVTDGAAQHWIPGFKRIEDGTLRHRTLDFEFYFASCLGEGPEMSGKNDSDHGSVWTSTDNTGGRSRTIGAQLSPALDEA